MIDPDQFDSELEAIEQPKERKPRISEYAAKELVVRPQVAERLISGTPIPVLARELGVPQSTIRRLMQTYEMADLIDIEARRVMRHLSKRNLAKEKYLGLTTAMAVLLDKSRSLKDGGMGNAGESKDKTIIQNISIALYGRGGREAGIPDGKRLAELAAESSRKLLEDTDESAASGDQQVDLGSDLERVPE